MFLVISIILALLFSIFTYAKYFKPFRNKHSDFVNFALTLIATLFGVFFALEITNWQEKLKEKKTTINLFESTNEELKQNITRAKARLLFISRDYKSNISIVTKINLQPVEFPSLYQSILQNDIVLKNASKINLSKFHYALANINTLRTSLNNYEGKSDEFIIICFNAYIKNIELAQRLVILELQHLHKDITLKELKVQVNQALDNYRKESTMQIDKIIN